MFQIRTSKPGKGNKSFIRQASGGWNSCIKGSPTDANCDVLANCVGYANGRFNEVITELTGYQGNKYNTLNCNAENFIERAKSAGLQIGTVPKPGAIICWQKGNTLSGSDGAGHVAFVEKVYDNNHIYTSESGYGSTAFWNQHRYNNNGRWGIGSGYTFRGFIYNPYVKDEPAVVITPNVSRDEYKNQIEVLVTDLRVRNGAGTDKGILGLASKGLYNFYETKDANGYKWYRIADGQWIASNEGWTNVYIAKPQEPIKLKYAKGQKMVFTGVLYADAKGNGAGQSRTNLVCTITLTEDSFGTTKPYNIDNGLGWVAEADLTPYVEPAKPEKPTLKEGDTVKIIGTGKSSIYGDAPTAKGIGWTRTILKVYEGKPYPYRVGNSKGTTGFYKADALEKK